MIYAADIGGVLLILGAYALYKGRIDYSVIIYFFADICWLLLAIENNQGWFGVIAISLGMLFGLGVWLKQRFGIFVKNLHRDTD